MIRRASQAIQIGADLCRVSIKMHCCPVLQRPTVRRQRELVSSQHTRTQTLHFLRYFNLSTGSRHSSSSVLSATEIAKFALGPGQPMPFVPIFS
jgi:hypothetical protein